MYDRKWIALAVLAETLLVSPSAPAFQNEPTGFRGVAWGTPIEQAHGLFLRDRTVGDRVSYRRSFEDLSINGIPLMALYFDFYRGRFEEAVLVAKLGTGDDLLRTFAARYGTPSQIKGHRHEFFWQGTIATIFLACSARHRTCTAVLGSNAMQAEDHAGIAASARDSKDF